MGEKNKKISEYIVNISSRMNEQYNGIMNEEKIQRAIDMFSSSDLPYEEIIEQINKLASQVIKRYIEEKEKRFNPELVKENHKEIYDKLEILIKKLNERGVDYQLAGALCAYIKYGVESSRTHDDIDINLNESDMNKFREVCEEMGLQFHDNRMTTPRVLKNGIPAGDHEVLATLDGSDFHIGAFCFERKPDGTIINKGYYHDNSGQIYTRDEVISPELAEEIFGREEVDFRGQKLVITPPEFVYKLKNYTKKDKDLVDIMFMEGRIDKSKLERINELSKYSKIEHTKVDMLMQLTPELQEIFSKIVQDSRYTSSELLKKYGESPEFQDFSKQLQIQWQQLVQQMIEERKQHSEMSDQDFFKFQVMKHSAKVIEGIKKDYKGQLTSEILDRLNKFNLEVKYDADFKHDITAYADKGMISINTAYFAKGKSLEEQIVQAMGTMPHEIFHFVFKMLKPEQLVDERMVYQLANGEIASNFGMVGHMLNEGVVEKLSTDFSKKNGIFYTISPSYIGFVNLCNYFMKHNPQMTEEFLMKHNYEDVLRLCTPEVTEAYKQTERTEYMNRFELKMQDGTYRVVKPEEIVKSFNQSIKVNDNALGQDFNYHTHTYRSGHSEYCSDEEILKASKQKGITKLGFSEHIPNPSLILPDEDHRMLLSEVDGYIASINKMKQNNPDMTILAGFEAEFDPMRESYLGEMREKVDYMILGQHFVPRGLMNVTGTNNPNYPIEYANMISKAIDSGIFDIVAHPDIFMQFRDTMDSEENKNLFDENSVIASQIICEKARDMGIPLEINLNEAFNSQLHSKDSLKYPSKTFWKVASEIDGLQVLQGIDAHTLRCIKDVDKSAMKVSDITEMMRDKFVSKDYNPVVARQNNVKLQEAYKQGQDKALSFETHMVNQSVSNICNNLNDGMNSEDIAIGIGQGLNVAMQECIDNANAKDKSVVDDISQIAENDKMPLEEKKVRAERKKKVIDETNQVLSNQQLVIGNAKNSVISAVNIGCQNKEEFINMTTQITEHNSSVNERHKSTIENQVSTFQQSKGTSSINVNEKNPILVKKQNSTSHNQSSGFASTASIIMIVTFIVGFVAGITYMICKFMIGG